jgi:hypothetical protein
MPIEPEQLLPGEQPGIVEWLETIREIALAGRIIVDPGSRITLIPGTDGTSISVSLPIEFDAELWQNNHDGSYEWWRVDRDPTGAGWIRAPSNWSSTPGVDSAHEASGRTDITIPASDGNYPRVHLRQSEMSGEYIFYADRCD